jgi:hypothetical protein
MRQTIGPKVINRNRNEAWSEVALKSATIYAEHERWLQIKNDDLSSIDKDPVCRRPGRDELLLVRVSYGPGSGCKKISPDV